MYENKWTLINILSGKCIQVNKPTMTAGRNKEDDLVCLSLRVSRNHANFILMNESLYVQDCGSANGTFINNLKIKSNMLEKLSDGDKVGLGICETMLSDSFQKYYIFQVSHYKLRTSDDIMEQIIIIDSDDDEYVGNKQNNFNNEGKENEGNDSFEFLKQKEHAKSIDSNETNGHLLELQPNSISGTARSNDLSKKDIIIETPKPVYVEPSKSLCVEKQVGISAKVFQESFVDDSKRIYVKTPKSINAESTGIDTESMRIDATSIKIDVAPGRTDTTSTRIVAEPTKIVAEPTQIVTEPTRIDAKSAKILDESPRIDAEPWRNDVEFTTIDDDSMKIVDVDSARDMYVKSPDISDMIKNIENEINETPLPKIIDKISIKPKYDLMKTNKLLVNQDSIIEIDDDDDSDNNEELICSQLYANTSANEFNNEPTIPDNIFSQIKKEMEEMDYLTPDPNPQTVLIDLDEYSNDDWFADFLQESRTEENASSSNNNNKDPKPKAYHIPPIIEPHVETKKKNVKEETNVHGKRRSSSSKISATKFPKKPRLEALANKLKSGINSNCSETKKTEFKNIRETRKLKLQEIALNSPKANNNKKIYGVETKSLNQPIPSTSAKLFPTNKPIKVSTGYKNVIVPQINITDTVLNMLNWQTSWLEQHRNSRTAPDLTKEPASKMMKEFKTYEDYNNNIIPLLTMEMWYSICRDFESGNQNDKKNIVTVHIEYCALHAPAYFEIDCIQIYDRGDNPKLLKEEDLVLIQIPVNMNKKTVYKKLFGYVWRTKKNQYHCHTYYGNSKTGTMSNKFLFTILVQRFSETINLEKASYIRFLTSITTHLRIFKSVKYLKHSPLCKLILKPNLDEYKLTAMEFDKPTTKDFLNSAQEEIVLEAASICMRDKPGLYLIKGPPGTGKTTVITNIIYQILFGNHRLSNNTCILLTAPSNAAIDELVLRIIKIMKPQLNANERKRLKLLRVGPTDMINSEVKRYSLKEFTKAAAMENFMKSKHSCDEVFIKEILNNKKLGKKRNWPREYKEKWHKAMVNYEAHLYSEHAGEFNRIMRHQEMSLLKNANIICTTLSSCIRTAIQELYKSSQNRNHCLIVDEATQSQEPETLIPLILGISKVVLVGDPQQLPATTISLPAKELGYGQSLFSRLQTQLTKKEHTLTRMLKIQYRMHPEICKYPNSAFYENMLENSMKYAQRRGLENIKPYVLFNLHVKENCVYQNDSEVKCVSNLIQALMQSIDKSCPYSIGVITPYNNQKDAIFRKLKELHINPLIHVAVNTVDSFQGKEMEIIILSCVRTDPNNFLADEKRLNVALTRAKSALFVIGASSLFHKCYVFGQLNLDAEKRNLSHKLYRVPNPDEFLKYIRQK